MYYLPLLCMSYFISFFFFFFSFFLFRFPRKSHPNNLLLGTVLPSPDICPAATVDCRHVHSVYTWFLHIVPSNSGCKAGYWSQLIQITEEGGEGGWWEAKAQVWLPCQLPLSQQIPSSSPQPSPGGKIPPNSSLSCLQGEKLTQQRVRPMWELFGSKAFC